MLTNCNIKNRGILGLKVELIVGIAILGGVLMKKVVIFAAILCFIMAFYMQPLEAAGSVAIKKPSLIVLGKLIENVDAPIIEAGKAYVPIRVISEALGYDVKYNVKTKVLDMNKDSFNIKLIIGDKNASVNGKKVVLDKAPYLVNGRAYVPASFIYSGFCISADYDKNSNTVKIGCLSPAPKGDIQSSKSIYIFDKKVDNEFYPLNINDKAMIPLRPIGEGLGYDIIWDINTQAMTLTKSGSNIVFVINKEEATVNNQKVKMDEKAKMISGRAYVSLEFLKSMMDYDFQYDKTANSLIIKEAPIAISRVQDISYNEESGYPQLYISADKPIEYKTFTLDNPDRLVIDIMNAIADTDFEAKEINEGDILRVRIGQFSNNPKVARIVVDLKSHKKAKVTQSQDKKTISLVYANIIQPITIGKEGYSDVITIKGSQPVDSSLFYLENPERIVIDIQEAVFEGSQQNIALNNSTTIKSVRTGQFDIGTARIVADLGKSAFYNIKYEGNETKVYISDIPFSFMGYDKYYNSSYITLNSGEKSDYTTNFDKKNKVLKLTIDKDIEYDKDLYDINDNLLEYIKLSKVKEKGKVNTIAEFKLKEKVEYEVLEPKNTGLVELKLVHAPTKPEDLLVIIDAGHGGTDPGAKAVDGSYEKSYNLDVAKRLNENLKELGFNTLMTREDDVYTSLQERADAANWNYADFFVSIHFNAYMNKTQGIETLYYPNTPSEAYNINNKEIASIFQEEIIKALKRPSRGVVARPDLFVLNKTNMPAILVELGFITNKEELSYIKKSSYKEDAAKALTVSLIRYYKEIRGIDFGLDSSINKAEGEPPTEIGDTATESVAKK